MAVLRRTAASAAMPHVPPFWEICGKTMPLEQRNQCRYDLILRPVCRNIAEYLLRMRQEFMCAAQKGEGEWKWDMGRHVPRGRGAGTSPGAKQTQARQDVERLISV